MFVFKYPCKCLYSAVLGEFALATGIFLRYSSHELDNIKSLSLTEYLTVIFQNRKLYYAYSNSQTYAYRVCFLPFPHALSIFLSISSLLYN